ncbi:MAG: hypothetical protein ACFFB3_10555 [Candidatus Hodarchaeota archaeon]
MSTEQYIDEYDRFKRLFEAVYAEIKRKKEHSNIAIAFLHLTSVYGEIEMEEMVGKWKGMIRILEAGIDKKMLPESERELIAAMLLLSTEIRSKQAA